MKRVLLLVLALSMIFAMFSAAGCAENAEQSPTADVSPSQSDSVKPPAESDTQEGNTGPAAPADLSGKKVTAVVPVLNQKLTEVVDSFFANLAEHGCTDTSVYDVNLDIPSYLTCIENYITMGVDLCMVVPMDVDGLEDISAKAIESGMYIIMLANYPPYEISGGEVTDPTEVGNAFGEMVLAWVVQNYPGSEEKIKVCSVVNESTTDNLKQGEAYMSLIDSSNIAEIAYMESNLSTGDEGFVFAERALLVDGEIKVFTLSSTEPAIGVNNYLISNPEYAAALGSYAIFICGNSDDAKKLIDDDTDSALHGMVYFGSDDSGAAMAEVAYKLLLGEEEAPYWIFNHPTPYCDFSFSMS